MAKTPSGISVVETGWALGVSASTVRRMIRRGDLFGVLHRGRRLALAHALPAAGEARSRR